MILNLSAQLLLPMQQEKKPLVLPPFYMPFPFMIHPATERTNKQSVAFVRKFKLYHSEEQLLRLEVGNSGATAGYLAPIGSEVALQIAADFTQFAFAFDDTFCDETPIGKQPIALAAVTAKMLQQLEGPEHPIDESDNWCMALYDMWHRWNKQVGPVLTERWVQGCRTWFFVEILRAGNNAIGNTKPNISDYSFIRRHTGATLSLAMLPYLVRGLDIPISVLEDRRVRALAECAALLTNWDNEQFSYAKEYHRTGDGHNMIDVIRHTYNLSVEDALHKMKAFRDRAACRFIRLRDEVLEDKSFNTKDSLLEPYLEGLGLYIRGIAEWSMQSKRYTSLDGDGKGSTFVISGYADHPSDDSYEPLPIGSIAWWWKVGKL